MRAKYLSALLFSSLLFFSCTTDSKKENGTQKGSKVDQGTSEMVAELKAISEINRPDIWHLNKQRAVALDDKIQSIQDPGQWITLSIQSAMQWLNAGEYNVSIERLKGVKDYVETNKLTIPDNASYQIRELLAIAFLRKGEIENCLENHNEYSCLLPIEKDGQHLKREGSESAIGILRDLLKRSDATAQTKWLYNVAHMTLGNYPNKVEPQYRIKPEVFESDIEFPRFTDVAMGLGLAVNDISGSVVMDDFNNDHYLDFMVSSYGLDDQLRYFENNGKGGFDDKTSQAGLDGMWSGLNMVQADYNNDGFVDVLVLRGAWLGKDGNHPNSLLKNNGDGTFSDVTKESGLYSLHPTQTASWGDFNGDGWIDLFIGNEYSTRTKAKSQLFENNGDGTFTNVAAEKGAELSTFIKGCNWGDFNNDGYPDLYVSSINGYNLLLKNLGPEGGFTFKNVAGEAGVGKPLKSFPCWFFDYDQDGWEDIFVSGFDFAQFTTAAGEVASDYEGKKVNAEMPRLFRNKGDGTFEETSESANLDKVLYTMGCNYGDLNNDGFPDMYAATGTPDFRSIIPNRMFLNSGKGHFYDVTSNGGFGHLQKGHGVAFGDIDMDGDQDVYNVLGGSYDGDNFMNALFLNPGMKNNWLKLKLIGKTSNRSAIGARIKVEAQDAEGATKKIYHTINSGASFGANPLMAELGLGKCDKVLNIEIKWPGAKNIQYVNTIDVNHLYVIHQEDDKVEKIDVHPLELNKHGHHHHHHH